MKVRGFGVPGTENPSEAELEKGVEVRNAFNGPIIAGLVAAVCGGDDPGYSWEVPEPGVLNVEVTNRS